MSRLLLLCAAALGSVGAYVLTAPAAPSRSRAAPLRMEEGVASLGLQETMPNQKSWMPKADDLALDNKKWYVVDAEGLRLGRMASEVAKILLGKHKASYTPGATMGDFVVITNCEKVIVTGKKAETKLYRRHSGRPGGMKVEVYKDLQQRIPEVGRVSDSWLRMRPPSRFSPPRPTRYSGSSRRRWSACSPRTRTAASSSAT